MKKNRHAVALGKLGGKARAESLSPEKRKEISANAAKARAVQKESLAVAGAVGGKRRAKKLTAKKRSEIARNAAIQRWASSRPKKEG